MFELPTVKKIEVNVTGGQETHPTAGYRLWRGMAVAAEPIVAVAFIEDPERYSWVRSSVRRDHLNMRIMFSPADLSERNISVSFGVGDSIVGARCSVPSQLTEPNPLPGVYKTGIVSQFAQLQSTPPLILHVLFLAKVDVETMRCGIWHLKVAHKGTLDFVWRKVLTFGRTGIIEKAKE